MTNKIIIALLIILSPIITTNSEAATLHAILIGDSHDDELGEAIVEDLNRMHKTIKKISNITKLYKNEIQLYGSKANRQNVLEKIKKIQVKSDDVVIAYFTMHGYRSKRKESRWPDLFFGQDNAGVDLEYFTDILNEKHPRLLIVLADCCNAYVAPGEVSSTWRKKTVRSYSRAVRLDNISQNYKELFLNTSGVIMASGSAPGEPSYGSDEEGSLFTIAFVESLESVTDDEDTATWEAIFEEVAEFVEDETDIEDGMDEPQTPQYQLDLINH